MAAYLRKSVQESLIAETPRSQRYSGMKGIDDLVDEIITIGIESALRDHAQQQQQLQQQKMRQPRQMPTNKLLDPKLNPISPPPTPYLTPATALTHGHLPSIETILEHPFLPQSLYESFRNGEDRVIDFDSAGKYGTARDSWENTMWEKLEASAPLSAISQRTVTPATVAASKPVKPLYEERKDSGIDVSADDIAALTPTGGWDFSGNNYVDHDDEPEHGDYDRSWSPAAFSPNFSCPSNSPSTPTTPAQFFASINEALASGQAALNMRDPKSAFDSTPRRRSDNVVIKQSFLEPSSGLDTPPNELSYSLSASYAKDETSPFATLMDAEIEAESWDTKMGFTSPFSIENFKGNALIIEATSPNRENPRQEIYHYWPPPTVNPGARPLERINEGSREGSRRGSLAY